ncbi:hypothetical protein QAD02_020154 [Eretmocerus hayati]|uniref:Uncharacterized protein n=1 Tax=Eretmocerus hayati TaxID=131215 RepID=A0ACC2PLQ3_9HYME|nr:hypothetical protein QAD02_020154 [Eretmocerus hayati]
MKWNILIVLILSIVRYSKSELNQSSIHQFSKGPEPESSGFLPSFVSEWQKKCSRSYSSMCLKFDAAFLIDKLSEHENLGILPGVSLMKQNTSDTLLKSDVAANLARDFPNDADKQMNAFLFYKIGTYLSNHVVSIKLFDPRSLNYATILNATTIEHIDDNEKYNDEVESARKKDKGNNNMMAGLMMMKGTLGALGFGALAMLAGKALMTGLMALMLSAIVGLKHLASGTEKKTTYEIVSKPVYTSSHSHSSEEHHGGYSGGYGRSLNVVAETLREPLAKYDIVRHKRFAMRI